MFYKFNAHRVRTPAEKSGYKHARQIYQKMISIQRAWAGLMAKGAGKLSDRWLKGLCFTVICLSCGYSAYLIYEGLLSLNKSAATGWTERIWPFDPYGPKQQLRGQIPFRRYLDSLENAVRQDSLNQSNKTHK